MFANKLSEQHGLKPTYDVSGIKFESRAEDGPLNAKSGKLKITAPSGDIYLAEGFRLPTEAEQEYVRRNLGQATGDYYFGNDKLELTEHAWYSENSGESVQRGGCICALKD